MQALLMQSLQTLFQQNQVLLRRQEAMEAEMKYLRKKKEQAAAALKGRTKRSRKNCQTTCCKQFFRWLRAISIF